MTLFPGGKGITRELLKVGVGPVSLDHAASLLGNPGGKNASIQFHGSSKIKGSVRLGGLVPAREGELDLAVVHLGDQGTSALAGGHHLAPDDLGQQVNIPSLSKFGSPG